MEKKGKDREPDRYEIESWTRTVVEAAEIMNDPKKMGYVKKEMDKKVKAIRSLEDVKKRVAEAG